MKLKVDKKAIRALGIAESFRKGASRKSFLAGVVMRSDLIIDGVVFGRATVEGDDATDEVLRMFRSLERNDINLILLDGAVISLYNILDVDRIYAETQTPVLCVTFKPSKGLEAALKHHFPRKYKRKLAAYQKLGERELIKVKTGKAVFARRAGVTTKEAKRVLDKFTMQGAIPEPIRVAKLMARARLTEIAAS